MILCHKNNPAFNENTWLFHHNNKGIIVDPGQQLEELFKLVGDIEITHIFVTHGHPDHIFGLEDTKNQYPNAIIVAHEKALLTFSNPDFNLSHYMNMEIIAPIPDWTFNGNQTNYNALDRNLQLFHTPGHAIDHICIYNPIENFVFVGDMIFEHESMRQAKISSGDPRFPEDSKFIVGRTDFPCGCDPQLMIQSVTKLLELPENTTVLSGHGDPFTIGEARTHILPLLNILGSNND